MKVYLTYWCNNEEYEDYNEMVKGAYSTRDGAVAAIEGEGYVKGAPGAPWDWLDGERWHKPHYWHFPGRADELWGYRSMWVREMEVDE